MTSPRNEQLPTPLAATSLKLVGAITILASLVDFLTLLIPPNFNSVDWQAATTGSMIDRGIVPLVGIALLFTGSWIETSLGIVSRRASLLTDTRFWTCLVSCFLGLIFFLLIFLYPNSVRLQRGEALAQVEAEAGQTAAQLEGQLNNDLSQRRAQIDLLLQDDAQLQEAIESGNLDEAQRSQIERFKDDPQALNEYLTAQVGEAQNQLQTRIGEEKQDAIARIKGRSLKATLRGALSSLLLAIGYIYIGWSGLRRLLAMVR